MVNVSSYLILDSTSYLLHSYYQKVKIDPVSGLVQREGEIYKERVEEDECSRIIMYSYMTMVKRDLLKLFHEGGGIKESDGGNKLNYDLL
jgi:hypothetical protein